MLPNILTKGGNIKTTKLIILIIVISLNIVFTREKQMPK